MITGNTLKSVVFFFSLLALTVSCESGDDPGSGVGSGDWSIPSNRIFDGGPGKDGIPALVNPLMISAFQATYLNDNDLVIGYKVDDDIRAYPHKILDWHEIINDDIGGQPLAITYCPLTGTAIGWDRMIEGSVSTFGVSGLLFNTNLIPFDRRTNSNWSQMKLECVNGKLIGDEIRTFQVVETTWGTWKEMYPNTLAVSTQTGVSRSYGIFPYFNGNGEDYRIDPFLLFPTDIEDDRLPRKERVHGIIINGQAKVYRIASFTNGITLLPETFQNEKLLVVGDTQMNFVNSFYQTLSDGALLEFTALQDAFPAVLEDNEGNRWDIFGEAISGPRTGQILTPTTSFIGYWFSWGTFYPNAEIFTP